MMEDFTDTKGSSGPSSELEYRDGIVGPQTDDEMLRDNNLGLGVYSEQEYWQQIDNFQQYLYAAAAFEENLIKRSIYIARRAIAREGFTFHGRNDDGAQEMQRVAAWDDLEPDKREEYGDIETYSHASWDSMGDQGQLQAVRKFTDYDPAKRLPQARLLLARHEMSRSKEGRLVDRALGDYHRVEEEDNTAPPRR